MFLRTFVLRAESCKVTLHVKLIEKLAAGRTVAVFVVQVIAILAIEAARRFQIVLAVRSAFLRASLKCR